MGGDLYMDYKKTYDALIQNRKDNPLPKDIYGEIHHIIPKSEGGTNDSSNLIRLSAREHYIAHLLLARIYNDFKMYCAVLYMSCKTNTHNRDYKFNSRLYEKIRKEFAKKISDWRIAHPLSGNKNGMYGRHHTEESKKKMRARLHGQRNGTNNSFYGRHHTEESKKKMSRSHKGKKLTEEQKNKLKATLALPDVKARISAAISEAQKGSFWVTDGKTNHFLSEGSPIPEGFYFGRTINSKSTTGYHWWNNGVINKLSKDSPGEGWRIGRINIPRE